MEFESLSKEFMASGKQPEFKTGFDYTILTPNNEGANLVYFNRGELSDITIKIDKNEIIVDQDKSFLICLTKEANDDVPNIVKNVNRKG